jgi:hypothetical protein
MHFCENVPADQNANQSQERFVDIGSFLIPDAQSPKLIEPSEHPPTTARRPINLPVALSQFSKTKWISKMPASCGHLLDSLTSRLFVGIGIGIHVAKKCNLVQLSANGGMTVSHSLLQRSGSPVFAEKRHC